LGVGLDFKSWRNKVDIFANSHRAVMRPEEGARSSSLFEQTPHCQRD
jgi:hypothetical protein